MILSDKEIRFDIYVNSLVISLCDISDLQVLWWSYLIALL